MEAEDFKSSLRQAIFGSNGLVNSRKVACLKPEFLDLVLQFTWDCGTNVYSYRKI